MKQGDGRDIFNLCRVTKRLLANLVFEAGTFWSPQIDLDPCENLLPAGEVGNLF